MERVINIFNWNNAGNAFNVESFIIRFFNKNKIEKNDRKT